MERKNDQLDTLVDAMLASAKYKHVCKELITYIGAQELSKRRNVKEALKATKNKLHQIGSAYLDTRVHYESWLNELRMAAPSANRDNLLHVCTRIIMLQPENAYLSSSSSTRKYLPTFLQFAQYLISPVDFIHLLYPGCPCQRMQNTMPVTFTRI